MNKKKDIHQASKHLGMPGTSLKSLALRKFSLKQTKTFLSK